MSNLGRKAELISPIPTKKSSEGMLVTHRIHYEGDPNME